AALGRTICRALRAFIRLQAASRVVGARRVDVEVDDFDAPLRLDVAGAGAPRRIAELDVAYPRQPQAAPLSARRQARFAVTAKLKSQRFLPPLRVAKDDGAKLAGIPAVDAANGFAGA